MRQDSLQQPKADAVDAIVDEWQRERPELDPSAKQVTGRIVRLASLFQQAYATAFATLGIGEGDYGVLVALRRAGEPFQRTPTDLARHRMITSGGMTAALDRLERRDLITRLPNPDDRRGNLVQLTAAGRRTVDDAMHLHTEAEHELVAALDDRERAQLERLLRKLMLGVDDPS